MGGYAPIDGLDVIYHGNISDLFKLASDITKITDAFVLPYKGNMDGVIPAKIMQCLATGIPTYISEFYDTRILKEYVEVFANDNELLQMLDSFDSTLFLSRQHLIDNFVSMHVEEKQYLKFNEIVEEK